MERRSGPQVGHLSPSMDAGVYKGVHTHHGCAQGHYVHGGCTLFFSLIFSNRISRAILFHVSNETCPANFTCCSSISIKPNASLQTKA